jgi:hypothetical protein
MLEPLPVCVHCLLQDFLAVLLEGADADEPIPVMGQDHITTAQPDAVPNLASVDGTGGKAHQDAQGIGMFMAWDADEDVPEEQTLAEALMMLPDLDVARSHSVGGPAQQTAETANQSMSMLLQLLQQQPWP